MNESDSANYTIALRDDQWELIVLAMRRIRQMTVASSPAHAIDNLSRDFLRRRVDEIAEDIESVVGAIVE